MFLALVKIYHLCLIPPTAVFFFFLKWSILKVFIEFVTILLLLFMFLFLAMRHVGS